MPSTHLTNLTIKKLEDRNFNPYYLIINNENQDEAFFCFEETINQESWSELEDNYEIIKEVELEYNEKESGLKVYRKVINLQVNNFKEIAEVF